MNGHSKTSRFMSELRTSEAIMCEAYLKGIMMDIEDAHECWAEHSDDYCASWLEWRNEADPKEEILQALTKWRERHPNKP